MNNNIYDLAKSKFKKYLIKNITIYSKSRNYDFGIRERDNVSNLSHFISHRILFEFEIIKPLRFNMYDNIIQLLCKNKFTQKDIDKIKELSHKILITNKLFHSLNITFDKVHINYNPNTASNLAYQANLTYLLLAPNSPVKSPQNHGSHPALAGMVSFAPLRKPLVPPCRVPT